MAGGVLRLSFEDADLILEEIAAEKKNLTRSIKQRAKRAGIAQNAVRDLPVDEAVLGELATIFTRVWLASGLQQILGATAPELVNADGEDLVFFQMRFPISDPNQSREIESRLDRVADLVREGADEPTWTWLSTTAPSGEMPAGARRSVALKTYDEQGQRVLGSVVLEPVAVVLNANSQERAERGREMLAKALEPLVGRPSTVAQTPEQVMTERPVDETGEETPELPLLPEEVTAAIHEVLDRHYREILSQPNPMFDGKSPEQAIRSKAGRQKVAEWLKQLENSAARLAKSKGIERYDHARMWTELEVSDLRQ